MKTFVVRLNPDLRECKPYSQYATEKEYKRIHKASPMNGFEECANFLVDRGIVRGYLPPKHSLAMRNGDPFTLITITAKSAKIKADQIVGIQYNCTYAGENIRNNPMAKENFLIWHYHCDPKNSIFI